MAQAAAKAELQGRLEAAEHDKAQQAAKLELQASLPWQ